MLHKGTMYTVFWMMGRTSRSSAPSGSLPTFGRNGATLEFNAFQKVLSSDIYSRMVFTVPTDPNDESEVAGPEKVDTKPILDEMWFLVLPTTLAMMTI